jgi:glutathione S-transferase
MRLYYAPISTYSQKALIAFHEKGVAFTPEIVNLGDPQGRRAFEQVYPIGKVPYLKVSDDHNVPESSTIIEFLEDRYPDGPRLINIGDAEASRQVRFMDRMADFYLNNPVVDLLFMAIGFRPQSDEAAAKDRHYLTVTYQHLDARLAKQDWICGAAFSMADCAAIPALFYAQDVFPFDAYPNLVRYWERANQRASYQKVRAEFEPIWNAMKSQQAA